MTQDTKRTSVGGERKDKVVLPPGVMKLLKKLSRTKMSKDQLRSAMEIFHPCTNSCPIHCPPINPKYLPPFGLDLRDKNKRRK